MAYREDEMTGRTAPSAYGTSISHRGTSSREIRHDIEHTRREMDRDLDALEQKLTPSQLALEAWSLFRGGAGRARHQIHQARIGFWQSMDENPLAIGVAALALGVVAGLLIPSIQASELKQSAIPSGGTGVEERQPELARP